MSFYPATYPQILSEDSPAARCLDLIARHAPRLMKQGGGQTFREILHSGKPITQEEMRKVIELRALGATWPQMAAAIHRSRSAVQKILKRAGLTHGGRSATPREDVRK